MCTATIIDASLFGWYASDNANDTPTQSAVALRKWINDRHGVIAYACDGRFGEELQRSGKMYSLFQEYRRNGRAFLVSQEKIQQAGEQIGEREIKSDDIHVLLLALASEALVLCTGDKKLRTDFKNKDLLPKVGGKQRAIYPYKSTLRKRSEFLADRKCPRPNT